MKLLMVCLGNICRSPLAEGIMRTKMKNKFDDFLVDSAGTISMHEGNLPDARSISIAEDYGLDISNQRSRPIKKSDFENFDYIFCMDKSNYHDVLNLAINDLQKEKVHLFLEFAGQKGEEVPDPYYGGVDGFNKVYQMIDEASSVVVEKIKNHQ